MSLPPLTPERRRVLELLLVTAGCFVAGTALSWPLLGGASWLITNPFLDSDLGYTVFVQWWAGEVMKGDLPMDGGKMVYFPVGKDVGQNIWNLVAVFGTGWLHWIFEPMTAYNVSCILIVAVNGLAGWLLGERFGGPAESAGAPSSGVPRRLAAFAGAAATLAFPYPWFELFDGRLEQGVLAPAAMFLIALADLLEGKEKAWIRVGVWMALTGATYWFLPPYLAIACLPLVLGRLKESDFRRDLAKAVGVCLLACLPFAAFVIPHIVSEKVQQAMDARDTAMALRLIQSLSLMDTLGWFISGVRPEGRVPILVELGLAWAAWKHPKARPWLLAMMVALVLCMGPAITWNRKPVLVGNRMIPLPLYLLDALPGFTRFWWPYRIMGVAMLLAIPALAQAAAALPKRVSGGLVALSLVEAWFLMPTSGERAAEKPGEVVQQNPDGGVTLHIGPSLLDFDGYGRYSVFEVPWFFRNPPEEPGAFLQFPLEHLTNDAAIYIPYHGHPVGGGDGMREPLIRPKFMEERAEKNAVLKAWVDDTDFPDDPAALAELYNEGFRWVLWHLPNPDRFPISYKLQLQKANRVSSVLGPPDHEEVRLMGWKIDPPR